jgi:hypothetical protein
MIVVIIEILLDIGFLIVVECWVLELEPVLFGITLVPFTQNIIIYIFRIIENNQIVINELVVLNKGDIVNAIPFYGEINTCCWYFGCCFVK